MRMYDALAIKSVTRSRRGTERPAKAGLPERLLVAGNATGLDRETGERVHTEMLLKFIYEFPAKAQQT
jgi:hypothetical protein